MIQKKSLPAVCEGECQISLFQKKEIRKVFHEGEWWFCVKDVIESLVETTDGTRYVADLRRKDKGLDSRYSEITSTLIFQSAGGKQNTNFINIEGIFRIMQSVPTKRAEPFKKWLARVGYERIQEIHDPEIAIKRAMMIYRAKGYDDDWIEARITNTFNRKKLTDEWKKRGVIEKSGILTDAIHVETFGIKTGEHKNVKGLKNQALRDNMTPIELTLSTLGEQATSEITKAKDSKSFHENLEAAKSGGKIAGTARREIEDKTGNPVVSSKNYLTERQRRNVELDKIPDSFQETMQRLLNVPPPPKQQS